MLKDLTAGVALLVDDEHFARLFALQILLDQGFVVLEAADASEALDILSANADVSVLFTDINMPGEMDGWGLVRHVRETHPELALIITSGHAVPGDMTITEGARFLAKPYTATALLETISMATGKEASKRPPPCSMVMLGHRKSPLRG